MILGFAHITSNVRTGVIQDHPSIPNPPEKWPLMARHATSHRLVVGERVELVEYDTGVVEKDGSIEEQASRVGVFGCEIAMRMRDLDTEYGFFIRGLGFTPEVGRLYLSSSFEGWRVRILTWVDQRSPIDPPLDLAGYTALAFRSTDVEADRDHLLKHGGRTPTEPFTVTLDRKMKIIMLRSPEGTIIELIQVLK